MKHSRRPGGIDARMQNISVNITAMLLLSAPVTGCSRSIGPVMDHPDFGSMTYNGIDAWDCQVDFVFPHRHSRFFAVHMWAPATGPSTAQRIRFKELKSRYGILWETIGPRIVAAHPTLASVEALNDSTSEYVAVHLGEHSEESVELVYTLNLADEDGRAYFVPLEAWEVGSVVVAD